jgi:hypothetical protein
MCSHFVFTLAAHQGPKFNVRRDLNSLHVAGRPPPGLAGAGAGRLRAFLARRCKATNSGAATRRCRRAPSSTATAPGAGPMKKARCSSTSTSMPRTPKDLLAVLASTGDWLKQALKKHSTLVEKNIDALAGLLQLNQAERALLLYGTLARYQRDLRSMLVEFKVSNAPEAYAVIADVAGVKAEEVGEALRAGSRLERIGLVENLISEHNITDLADLMKVSEKLPPVLMREYRDQAS